MGDHRGRGGSREGPPPVRLEAVSQTTRRKLPQSKRNGPKKLRARLPPAMKKEDSFSQQSRPKTTTTAMIRRLSREREENMVKVPPTSPFKSYGGDIFSTRGQYMSGVIYKSRLAASSGTIQLRMPTLQRSNTFEILSESRNDQADLTPAPSRAPSGDGPPSSTREQTTAPPEDPGATEAKIHCVQSFAAWSAHPENVARLVEEGAVGALLVLSKHENLEIRRSCAITFRNMSKHLKLCEQLVDLTAVPFIADLGVSKYDPATCRDCCYALVNLTNLEGVEASLVEGGIVSAFSSLMAIEEDLCDACCRGLFNLTCVDGPYQHMEKVFKTFISLAGSTTISVRHLCCTALCNLSDMKSIRHQIVEDGVVQAIGILARGAEARTRRVCAITLHLLASTRSCRPEMVSKGTVQVLYSLSSDIDTITLHYIASALIKLSKEEQNMPRIVHEGGVTALRNICVRCQRNSETTQLCASGLRLLSRRAIGREAIVQEDCVPSIVTFLNQETNTVTIRNSLSAFTSLLVENANHDQVLTRGGIDAVIKLCSHSSQDIREACALAMFNFTRGEAHRDETVSLAAVPALITLSRQLPEARTRMRCAATLCRFTTVEKNVALMVEAGIVPAFIDMLQTRDQDITKHCCAALCRLANEGRSAVTITQGAVPHVIAGCGEGSDTATRQSCCAVLSAISAHESCRQPLCEMGALHALMSLAGDRTADDTTRLRCAVAFANLSNDPSVQEEMVESGIVPVVAELSNSYCEENQLCCARALCNLSSRNGCEEKVVQQGGVAALMMISMVRAVSHLTKQVCAMALLNLISTFEVRERWLKKLSLDGLLQNVSVLSRLEEEETMFVCAQLFCILSADGVTGRKLLIERSSTLTDVLSLSRSRNQETQLLCGKTACNLLGFSDTQKEAVSAGAVKVLAQMCSLRNHAEAEDTAATAFYLVAGQEDCRLGLVDDEVLPVLLSVVKSENASTRRRCLEVLVQLAWSRTTRNSLLKANVIQILIEVVPGLPENSEDAILILYIFAYMAFLDMSCRNSLIDQDVVLTLPSVVKKLRRIPAGHKKLVRSLVSTLLRLLAEVDDLEKYVSDGAIPLLCHVMHSTEDIKILEHCATTLCNIARRQRYNEELVQQGAIEALAYLAKSPPLFSLAAATLHVLSLEAKHREKIILAKRTRDMLLSITEGTEDDPSLSSTVESGVKALFWLSRCASIPARDSLVSAGVVPLLVKLSRHQSEIISATCAEALKNVSNGTEDDGIEEGTVSTLIAATLQSGKRLKCVDNEQSILVEIPSFSVVEDAYAPPDNLVSTNTNSGYIANTISTAKQLGGAAGVCPAPPDPPEMDVQENRRVSDLGKQVDVDTDDEDSPVASMYFAKMKVADSSAK